MLTFELSDDALELHVVGDEEGLRALAAHVLRTLEARSHEHLMTPSWAGTELTEERQTSGTLLNKVTIHFTAGPAAEPDLR